MDDKFANSDEWKNIPMKLKNKIYEKILIKQRVEAVHDITVNVQKIVG